MCAEEISEWIVMPYKIFSKIFLDSNIKAVENGIRLPWSNETVEGYVNRIKCIKRKMYGKATFDLLRRSVILSQNGVTVPKCDEEPV